MNLIDLLIAIVTLITAVVGLMAVTSKKKKNVIEIRHVYDQEKAKSPKQGTSIFSKILLLLILLSVLYLFLGSRETVHLTSYPIEVLE